MYWSSIRRVLLSILISVFILYLLWHLFEVNTVINDQTSIQDMLLKVVWPIAGFYVITQLSQTLFRALRYRLLLLADQDVVVPSYWVLILVSLCRNMFVDLLPARLGELSYIVMLNRLCRVPVPSCVSSLGLSFVLDILALTLILVLILVFSFGFITVSGTAAFVTFSAAAVVSIIASVFVWNARPIARFLERLLNRWSFSWFRSLAKFIDQVASSVEQMLHKKIFLACMGYSLLVRFFKYTGLLLLFYAVTSENLPELYNASWWQVFPAFVTAEATASLPVPVFMSFGLYEAGGMLALSALGYKAAEIFLVMLLVHVLSQVVEYILGGLGLLGFVFVKK